MNRNINELIIMIIIFVFSIVVHELAHAYTAYKLGDYTVKEKGRLTLNPLAHLDPVGTIALLLFGFGWAKPVQVDPRYFKDRDQGLFLTALAGPASNFILGAIFYILLFIQFRTGSFRSLFLITEIGFQINLMLMILNLIPIPPLDGSKLMIKVMDKEAYHNYTNNRFMALIFLFGLLYTDVLPKIFNTVYVFLINFIV